MFFWHTLQIVAPVFILAFIGLFLKKIRLINLPFVEISNRLVFHVALPCLIFVKLAPVDFIRLFRPDLVLTVCLGTILVFFLVWLAAKPWIRRGEDLGVFVQGSFRSNFAIVGFAVIWNLYGESGLAQAAVILAFIMPLYNLLAIIVLTVSVHRKKLPMKTVLCRVMTNPLMIAVLIALIVSMLHWQPHPVLLDTAEILSRLALPLALLGIGGSLNTEAVRSASKMAITASLIKLILIPAGLTAGAIYLGFRDYELGILFILFGSPTAVSSFVMADAMGANSKLAGNIVLISTIGATLTLTAGIVLLHHLGYLPSMAPGG